MDKTTENPLAAWVTSFAVGFSILYISIFTVTISHWSLPYLRLALSPVAIVSFWNFGFGPYDEPSRTSGSISLYFIGRVLDQSLIAFWDEGPPHWVIRVKFPDCSRTVVALPRTFWARCVYALDLLTSVRGLSWFADLEWSWASPGCTLPPLAPASRRDFISMSIRSVLLQYLLYDLCDTILEARTWDPRSPNPVSELSIAQQCLFVVTICVALSIPMTVLYILVSIIAVLCGSSPLTWPPLFDSFLASTSLSDFWSRRWHRLFRRILDRLSLPMVQLFEFAWGGTGHANAHVAGFVRNVSIFALSTLLHLLVMQRIALVVWRHAGRKEIPLFIDGFIIRFFLSQPLGLVVESAIITPLANWLFHVPINTQPKPSLIRPAPGMPYGGHADGRVKSTRATKDQPVRWEMKAVTRLYGWAFLIWTGRWLLMRKLGAVWFIGPGIKSGDV